MCHQIGLDEALESGMPFESTSPHDKVYALYGLVTKLDLHNPDLKPRYELSTKLVFTDTMRYLLQTSDPLYLLHLAGSAANTFSDLPSWVPDFTNRHTPVWQLGKIPVLRASKGHAALVEVPSDHAEYIKIGGNVVDEIAHIASIGPLGIVGTPEWKGDTRAIYQSLHDWLVGSWELVSRHCGTVR